MPKSKLEARREKSRERMRAWREANREESRERSRRWAAENREKLREKARKYHHENREKALASQRKWRLKNKEREAARSRSWHQRHPEVHRRASLKRRYGISVEFWEAMFRAQGRRCACCGSSEPKDRQWHTDHCHKTGVFRGILCRPCNLMLIEEADAVRLAQGIKYLSEHPGIMFT
jgi:hypothetical protein